MKNKIQNDSFRFPEGLTPEDFIRGKEQSVLGILKTGFVAVFYRQEKEGEAWKSQEKIERRMRLQPEEISLSELEKRFLEKIQALIEENLSDPDFGVDRLASALDISRPTLYRKIMALTGQPPNKFIQAYRLKRSVDLLKSHSGNITEVAFKVSFSSSAYFSKCFKDTFHRSPSDFQPF